VATIAFDDSREEGTPRPPISLHPAFPGIVALWFAALLGLGSLVLPVVLLERAVVASGIASLVPAASPPLGFTARAILAAVGTFAGAAIGIAIARRVARAHRPRPESRVALFTGSSRRPISIKDEIGGEGVVNGESLPINRRRALAISEDDRPSDFLYRAPLPGDSEHEPTPLSDEPAAQLLDDPEPLELSDLAEDAPDQGAFGAPDPAEQETIVMTQSREFQPPSSSEPLDATRGELSEDGEFDNPSGWDAPVGSQPLQFSPPSMARRSAEGPETSVPAESDIQLAAVESSADSRDAPAHADWETAPLEGLGLVQLVQRLGSTIERRRELMAQAQAAPVVAAAPFATSAAADLEAAPAEEAAQAMAAYFGSAPATEALEEQTAGEPSEAAARISDLADAQPSPMAFPTFLQPLSAEEDDDEDVDAIPDFSLPLRRRRADTPPVAAAVDEGTADDSDPGYSSLLGLNNPFGPSKHEFVRIEEPDPAAGPAEQAVVFPGQEEPAGRLFDPPGQGPAAGAPRAQAPADADAALRAALATLQRMSGAA